MQEQPTPNPADLLRDIAPPLDVFPYPLWMVIVAAVVALAVLGVLIALLVAFLRRKKPVPPPQPHEVALRQLADARAQVETADPYEFSIIVSNILRTYISARYGLPATRQTSPEFLTAAARSPLFSEEKQADLSAFLEKADLIKFAHIEATPADSLALLEAAESVVRGGSA